MTEEPKGDSPAGDAESKPASEASFVPTIEQRVVALEAKYRSQQAQGNRQSDSLLSEVKTGEQLLIGINALVFVATCGLGCIYFGQLKQMRASTDASTQSAYVACVSSKIAEQTLIEMQKGAEDTHDATRAALYQALMSTQAQSPFIHLGYASVKPGPDGSLDVPYQLKNVGKSAAVNLTVKIRVEIVGRDEEPSLSFPDNTLER